MPESLVALRDRDLGNTSHLLDLGDGRALVVDPPRDLRAVRRAAASRRLRIAHVAETHLHADFLSGAHQLARDDGARVLASKAGDRTFPHTGLADDDEVDLGGLTLRALATPGHTGEHLAFLVLDGARPFGVFTGGSLLAGSAARVDLSGPEHTAALLAAQHRSLHRLAQLPDDTAVWPTHGGGSFCSTAASGGSTTIGAERAGNPLLTAPDESTFARLLAASMGSFPPYFLRLPELNRRAPLLDSEPRLRGWTPDRVAAHVAADGLVVDVRQVERFAAGHVPGSVSVAWRPGFTAWLGWLADAGEDVVLVRDEEADPAELAWRCRLIGLEGELGELTGGIDGWASVLDVATLPLVGPGAVAAQAHVLDVRQEAEYAAGHAPGSIHVELGTLARDPRNAVRTGREVVVACGHGERAATGASLLLRAGVREVSVLRGDVADLPPR